MIKGAFEIIALLVVSIFLTTSLSGEEVIQFKVVHNPPKSPETGQDLKLEAEIAPGDDVFSVKVFFRGIGDEKYREFKMRRRKGTNLFFAIIPGEYIKEPGFEYYLLAIDRDKYPHSIFKEPSYPQKVMVGEVGEFEYMSALEEEFALFEAEDIIFAAAKREQKARESPAVVTVIKAEDIKKMPVLTITDILRYAPGMDVYSLNPAFTLVGIRGFADEFNNLIVVLLDGREINVELTGAPLWEFIPVQVDDIERIEIIRGPGGALYGPNAFSGVINIVTKDPEKYSGFGFKTLGGYPITANISLSYRKQSGSIKYSVNGGHRTSFDNYLLGEESVRAENIGFRINKIFSETSSLSVDLGFVYGMGKSYYLPFSPINSTDLLNPYIRFSTKVRDFKGEIYFYWVNYSINTKDYNDFGKNVPLLVLNDITGDLNLQYDILNLEWMRLSTGGNTRINYYQSEQLLFAKTREIRYSVYFQDELIPMKNLFITIGLRYDGNTQVQPAFESTLSPRGSIVYTPVPEHTIKLSIGRAFRKPSFLEYGLTLENRDWQNKIADELLKDFNEEYLSFDLNYVATIGKRLKIDVAVFYSQFLNAISYNFDSNKFQNFKTDSYALGGEVALEFIPITGISGFMNYSYERIISMDNFPVEENPIVPAGKRFLEYPEHKLNIGTSFRPMDEIIVSIFGTMISKRDFIKFRGEKNISLDNYFILNIIFSYIPIKDKLEIGIIGKNLFDVNTGEYAGISPIQNTSYKTYAGGEPNRWGIFGFIGGLF